MAWGKFKTTMASVTTGTGAFRIFDVPAERFTKIGFSINRKGKEDNDEIF